MVLLVNLFKSPIKSLDSARLYFGKLNVHGLTYAPCMYFQSFVLLAESLSFQKNFFIFISDIHPTYYSYLMKYNPSGLWNL